MHVFKSFDLSEYNSYHIKAKCARAFFPNDEEDFLRIFKNEQHKKKHILGNGNNIILSRPYYQEDFIILNGCFDSIDVHRNLILAEAGARMIKLSDIALQHSLTGFEVFYDIPSSVGGAIVMNAGANGEEIKDVLLKVRYLDLKDMQIKELQRDELDFEYRNSFFHKHPDKVVLKAWFGLKVGDSISVKAKMETAKLIRWSKQPREYPNCGSVFKRPKGQYVGAMIEQLGLKGYRIGGAMVSEKHAGFIINYRDATGQDVLTLIEYIKREVHKFYGIDLELEQCVI